MQDLDGRPVEPMPTGSYKAIVFVFLRIDCPISNRYAPELRRLHDKFASQNVAFRLVFTEPGDLGPPIRAHLADYKLPGEALRDPEHRWAHRCGVKTTPEAAVFLADRATLLYRGRIDDRYVDFGLTRPEPTTHDLEDAIAAALAGRTVTPATTVAVGCPIVDEP